MEKITLTGKSKRKIDLIAELAENLGLTVERKMIEDETMEEEGLINAMESAKTGKYLNTEEFLKQLKR